MKAVGAFLFTLCLLLACGPVHAKAWRPVAGHTQIPIWPGVPPDQPLFPGPETATVRKDDLATGAPHSWTWIANTNVATPTMTVYGPQGKNTGAAVVVFPGGGFQVLAMDLEGTEVCHWITSIGITCVLLKYRVPSAPYSWRCKCYPRGAFTVSVPALEDAQRTIRLVRFHAAQYQINPHKVGVIGFSAGGYLVAEASADFNRQVYKPVDAADGDSDRPDFAMAIYPGHIETSHGLNSNLHFTRRTPPTFIVQAEMTTMDHVRQSLGYYAALAKAGVPAEMHLYARGGHAFGVRPTKLPIGRWPQLADTWLHTIGVIGK
ncbi:MAG: alpha/beta hydrolase [Rhodanobacteraceae bacterium]